MKRKLVKLLSLSIILFNVTFVSAQIYVKIRPVVPVIVITPQPSPAHVWIQEDWVQDGNGYRYIGGHWDSPPHNGYRYREGHWKQRSYGHKWVHGGWRR